MASLDELLTALFGTLGPAGSLVILLVIFAIDAALFPALPEVWIVVTYTYRPEPIGTIAWAGLLLAMAVAGDILGTSLLYAVVRRWVVQRGRMPHWLERSMKKWTSFLLVRDERVILMNRAVPVIPMVGAFIATLGWNYRRSMAYVAAGGLAKYAVLLYVVFAIGVVYDVQTARWITLALVAMVVGLSFVASWFRRRRIETSTAPRS
jgi:membrane protein DedA with SNARE-associated domain